jgi:hypothetical protein
VSGAFVAQTVLRTAQGALCPACRSIRFSFRRLPAGGMSCLACSEKRPTVTREDLEFPARELGLVVRNGAPVLCCGCSRPRRIFSLASGLCLKCHP